LFWFDAGNIIENTIVNLLEHHSWMQAEKFWCLQATIRGWVVFVFDKVLAIVVSSPV
jgi:hypothetical protein